MKDWKLVDIPRFYDVTRGGTLGVAEINKVADGVFDSARRVYYIVNNEEKMIERGGHYHPAGGKQEFWLVPTGRLIADLHGPNKCQIGLILDQKQALLIPSGVWHSVKLDPGTVLISVSSTNFHKDESVMEMPSCHCQKK